MPPETHDGARQSDLAGALARRGGHVAGLSDGRGRDAADRFRVYRNNVIHSLVEALGATFPATRRAMGADDFRGAAIAYAEAVKPASPVLARYGEAFPAFLARPGRLRAHVPEIAAIEYARVQAFHAADGDPLAPDALARLAPDRLASLVFPAHPAACLVPTPGGGASAYVGASAASRDGGALVTRPADAVLVARLDAPAFAFAQALFGGAPLAEAANREGLDLSGALASLLSSGAFAGLS